MNRIQINLDICNSKPTILETRITVQTIMEFLEASPQLTEADIYVCIQFTAKLMARNYFIREIV